MTNNKQVLGRLIRSEEAFENFLLRINKEIFRDFTSDHGNGISSMMTDYKQLAIREKDFQRLLLEIESRELLVLPYSHMGFRPAYEVCEVVGNPLFEYETKTLTKFHSDQFPAGFTHKQMKKYFGSNRNLQLAELVGRKIILEDSHYYY